MATIIRLEKDGYMKDAFVGYSYTTAFFNAFVPAARQDLQSFLFFGGIYFFKISNISFEILFNFPFLSTNTFTVRAFAFKTLLESYIS